MKRKYKKPNDSGGLQESEFWWNGNDYENYERLTMAIRSMPLYRIERQLVDFIFYQLIGKILVEEE